MSLQYLKKKLEMKFIFCMQINIKVDFNTLDINVSYKVILSLLMGMIKHSQSTQSSKFAIFLHYPWNYNTQGDTIIIDGHDFY